MAKTGDQINPALIAALVGKELDAAPERATIAMLPGRYVAKVWANRDRVERLTPKNPHVLRCLSCGQRGRYDLSTLVFDAEGYGDREKSAGGKSGAFEDFLQILGYFRCKRCNSAGQWELPKDLEWLIMADGAGNALHPPSDPFEQRVIWGVAAMMDGFLPRFATDGEEHYLQMFARNGEDAFLWDRLGNLYMKGGRPELAAAAFEQSIQLDPQQVESHASLGQMLFDVDEWEDAARHHHLALLHARNYHRMDTEKLRMLLAESLRELSIMHLESERKIPLLPDWQQHAQAQGESLGEPGNKSKTLMIRGFDLNPSDQKSYLPLADIYLGHTEEGPFTGVDIAGTDNRRVHRYGKKKRRR